MNLDTPIVHPRKDRIDHVDLSEEITNLTTILDTLSPAVSAELQTKVSKTQAALRLLVVEFGIVVYYKLEEIKKGGADYLRTFDPERFVNQYGYTLVNVVEEN